MNQDAELIVEREDSILNLELNRPGRMNALNATLVDKLIGAVRGAYHDGTRVLILRGAGRNFSAGFDLSDVDAASDGDLLLRFVRIEQLLQAVYHAPYDTVALAHGRNFGAGVDLICACAHRIADPEATFRMPGLQFGVVLGTRRLAQRVGLGRARSILQGALSFTATNALEIGFCESIEKRSDWTQAVSAIVDGQSGLSEEASTALYRCTVDDTRAADLAELVQSASIPGFRERIQRYRATARGN